MLNGSGVTVFTEERSVTNLHSEKKCNGMLDLHFGVCLAIETTNSRHSLKLHGTLFGVERKS